MKRLLITGTRNGWFHDDLAYGLRWAYYELAEPPEDVTLVHGAAPGVDLQAAAIWAGWGMSTEAHPAPWDQYPRTAGPMRNSTMVDLGADLCIAFPVLASKGTYDCMRKAQALGIRVVNWPQEGDLTREPMLW